MYWNLCKILINLNTFIKIIEIYEKYIKIVKANWGEITPHFIHLTSHFIHQVQFYPPIHTPTFQDYPPFHTPKNQFHTPTFAGELSELGLPPISYTKSSGLPPISYTTFCNFIHKISFHTPSFRITPHFIHQKTNCIHPVRPPLAPRR